MSDFTKGRREEMELFSVRKGEREGGREGEGVTLITMVEM